MREKISDNLPILAALAFTTIFCIHYVFAKEILKHTDAYTLACMRGLFGGLILLVFFFRPTVKVLKWPMIGKMALPAFFGVLLNQILFLEGIKRTVPLHAAVLANTIPVFSTMLAIFFRFEKGSWRLIAAVLAGLVFSCTFILSGRSFGGMEQLSGDFLILLNVFSICFSFLLFKRWLNDVDTRAYTTFALTTVGLVLFISRPSEVVDFIKILPTNSTLALYTFYEVFVATSIAYFLNFYALKRLKISTVTCLVFIQPIITHFVTQWLGGDERPLTFLDYVSFLGIIVSVLVILNEKRIDREKRYES